MGLAGLVRRGVVLGVAGVAGALGLDRGGDVRGLAVTVAGIRHMTGTSMTNGIAVGEDMWLQLEPLDSAAALTLRRTTPVVAVEELPAVDPRS